MAPQDCSPPYTYTPSSTPTEPANAPSYTEKRSRVFAGGTFFRSKEGGTAANDISIELVLDTGEFTLNVYVNSILQETHGPVPKDVPDLLATSPPYCILSAANALRTIVNADSMIIEMPETDGGADSVGGSCGTLTSLPNIFEYNNLPTDIPPGDDCLTQFGPTFLTGADGLPTGTVINSIYTGPERTLIILQLTEICGNDVNDTGFLYDPPANRKVLQWDGSDWITYTPNSDCCI